MKLIDEKEVEEAAKKYDSKAYCGHFSGEEPSYHFKSGANFAEQKLQPMMVELIDWIDENEWNNNVTSREKLEQFLKNKQK